MSSGMAYAEASPAMAEDVAYQKQTKKKKPSFFGKWLLNSLKTAAEAEKQDRDIGVISAKEARALKMREDVSLNTEPMRFSIYKANGGFVVETRTPNNSGRNTIGPETNTRLHIIRSSDDLGEELAKIITLEGLRA